MPCGIRIDNKPSQAHPAGNRRAACQARHIQSAIALLHAATSILAAWQEQDVGLTDKYQSKLNNLPYRRG
eukprot:359257-Chlamydomonas_euryale.AAC.3